MSETPPTPPSPSTTASTSSPLPTSASSDTGKKSGSVKPPEAEMNLFDHLRELRGRLFKIVIVVCLLAAGSYPFSSEIFYILQKPYEVAFVGNRLTGTSPADALILKMTIAMCTGVVVGLPYIFYQLWAFISPGLYESEKKHLLPFVTMTTICFLAGMGFCYYIILPYSYSFFFQEFISLNLQAMVTIDQYFSFTLKLLLGFGVIFEMPVLSLFLARLGVLSYEKMIKSARYVILALFVIAAVVSPPDVMSQLLIVAPMIALFGLSILIVRIFGQTESEERLS